MTTERIDLEIRDRIARTLTRRIRTIGQQATQSATAVGNLQRSLRFGGGSFLPTRGVRNFERNITSVQGRVRALGRDLRAIAGLTAVFAAARGLTSAIDTYQNLQNRLRTVTEGSNELAEATDMIFAAANRARAPVTSFATTFVRLDKALSTTGRSQQEVARITETINKLLVLNGSTSEEAASATLQLSQAFTKGKLDGDEFRSAMENMPRVFQDGLINTLGITRAELFKFSRDGKITADVLAETFENLADQVDRDFQKLPLTIGQAMTRLSNNFTRAFGRLDQQVGITRRLAAAIETVSRNADVLVGILAGLAAGAAAFVGIRTLATAFDLISRSLSTIITLLVSGRVRMVALGSAATFLLNPLTAIPAIIGIIIGLLYIFRNQTVPIGDGFVTIADILNAIYQRSIVWYNFLRTNIVQAIRNIFDAFRENETVQFLGNALTETWQRFLGVLGEVARFVGNTLIQSFNAIFALGQAIMATWERFSELNPDAGFFDFILAGLRVLGVGLLDIAIDFSRLLYQGIEAGINLLIDQLAQVDLDLFGQNLNPFRRSGRGSIDPQTGRNVPSFQADFGSITDDGGLLDRLRDSIGTETRDLLNTFNSAFNDAFDQDVGGEFFNAAGELIRGEILEIERLAIESARRRRAEEVAQQQQASAQRTQITNQERQREFAAASQSAQRLLGILQGRTNSERSLLRRAAQSQELDQRRLTNLFEQEVIRRERANAEGNERLRRSQLRLTEEMTQLWQQMSQILQRETDTFVEYIIQRLDQILQRIRQVLGALQSAAGAVDNATGGALGAAAGAANRSGLTAQALAGPAGPGIQAALSNPGVRNFLSNLSSQVQQGFTQGISNALASNQVNQQLDAAGARIVNQGRAGEFFGGNLSEVGNQLQQNIANVAANAGTTAQNFGQIANEIRGAGQEALQLQNQTEGITQNIRQAGQDRTLQRNIERTAEQANELFGGLGGSFGSNFGFNQGFLVRRKYRFVMTT